MSRLSDRLGNVLNWFRKEGHDAPVHFEAGDDGAGCATLEESPPPPPTATLVRRNGTAGNGRDSGLAKLERGYDEVIDLLHAVRDHMKEQSARSDRMLAVMEDLPEALRSLPEASRNQARMLETIEDHFEQHAHVNQKLTEAMGSLARSTDHHDQVMNVVQQQLTAGQETDQHMLKSFSTLNGTLGRLNDSNVASADLLRSLTQRGKETDAQMRELFSRNQKQITVMSVVSWTLAIVALTVAAYVAVSVGRFNSSPAPAAPTTPASSTAAIIE